MTGTVALQDPIYGEDAAFEVSVTELRIDDETGCVRIDNSGSDEGFFYATDFGEGETRTLTENDVGSFGVGDEITVVLIAQSACDGTDVDTGSTTVTEAPTPTPSPTPGDTPTPSPSPSQTATTTPSQTATTTPGTGDPGDADAPTFNVTIDDVRGSENEGGSIEVDATIRNDGSESDTQTVVLTGDGAERDSQEVTLEPGESQTVTFTWDDPEEAEQRSLRVATEDDRDESSIRITETETGDNDDLIPGGAGGILLLLLLLALLVAYYYVRRRQMAKNEPDVE